MANLVNSGILPMVFVNEEDYGKINPGDRLVLKGIRSQVEKGIEVTIFNASNNTDIRAMIQVSDRQRKILLAGGLINYTRETQGGFK
jgi:aconitate hydratase